MRKYYFNNFVMTIRQKYGKTIIPILALILICGCVERTVKDNRFFSSSPKMNIHISDEFVYSGPGTYIQKTSHTNDPKKYGGEASVDFYFFSPKKYQGQIIQKGVIISLHQLGTTYGRWAIPIFDRGKLNVYNHGLKFINDENYEFVTMAENTSHLPVGDWLRNRKIYLPTLTITRILACKVDDKTFKQIAYFEDADLFGLGYSSWYGKKILSEEQLKLIDEFEKRAEKAVQINRAP